MLSVAMLNVVTLSIVILSIIMLSVDMLSDIRVECCYTVRHYAECVSIC